MVDVSASDSMSDSSDVASLLQGFTELKDSKRYLKEIVKKLKAVNPEDPSGWLADIRSAKTKVLSPSQQHALLQRLNAKDAEGHPVLTQQEKAFLILSMSIYGSHMNADGTPQAYVACGQTLTADSSNDERQACLEEARAAMAPAFDELVRQVQAQGNVNAANIGDKVVAALVTSDSPKWGPNRIALPNMIRAMAFNVETLDEELGSHNATYDHRNISKSLGFDAALSVYTQRAQGLEAGLVMDADAVNRLVGEKPVKKKSNPIGKIMRAVGNTVVHPIRTLEHLTNPKSKSDASHARHEEAPVVDVEEFANASHQYLVGRMQRVTKKLKAASGSALWNRVVTACRSGHSLSYDDYQVLIRLPDRALSRMPEAALDGYSEENFFALVSTMYSEARTQARSDRDFSVNNPRVRTEMALAGKVIRNRGEMYWPNQQPNLFHAVSFDAGRSFEGWTPSNVNLPCMFAGLEGREPSSYRRAVRAYMDVMDPRTKYMSLSSAGHEMGDDTKYFAVGVSEHMSRLVKAPAVLLADQPRPIVGRLHKYANRLDAPAVKPYKYQEYLLSQTPEQIASVASSLDGDEK